MQLPKGTSRKMECTILLCGKCIAHCTYDVWVMLLHGAVTPPATYAQILHTRGV